MSWFACSISKVVELAKLWPHDVVFFLVLGGAYATLIYYMVRAVPGFLAVRKGRKLEGDARICASMSRCIRMLCYLTRPIMIFNFIGVLAVAFKLPSSSSKESGDGAASHPMNPRSPWVWLVVLCGACLGVLPSQCARVIKNRLNKAEAEGRTSTITAYQSGTLVLTSVSAVTSTVLLLVQNSGVTKMNNGFEPDFTWAMCLITITIGLAISNLVYLCSADVASTLFLSSRRVKAPYPIDLWCDENLIMEMYATKRDNGDEKVPISVEYRDEKEAIPETMV
ncbi:hypothetical protein LTS18_006450 [Coniosporium uncinatum]|uniref:Uncharacterized protein n=1 Tax=Coniosporium uncinatum TaxID=93489 RepID=A0ACC3DQF3_9PEZI|nr:hypothetical protein LTS18_006450 [Coniosporium uncinatum]